MMRRIAAYLLLAAGAGLFLATSFATANDDGDDRPGDVPERADRGPEDGPPPPGSGRRQGRGDRDRHGSPDRRGPGGHGGPPHHGPPPIIAALDGNDDGVISASEIDTATAALRKLDKNDDGELTREELHPGGPPPRVPEFGRRGPERRGDRGRRGRHSERRGRGDRGPRDRGDRDRAERRGPPSPERFVDHVMESDKDGNGEVSRDELLEAAKRLGPRRGRGHHGPRGKGNEDERQRPEPDDA